LPHEKFDIAKLERLDDEARFTDLDPDVMWSALGCPDVRVIVDVGAGTGLFARRFAELAPSATVYAVDTAVEAVRWMEAHGDPALVDRVRPMVAEESHIPLPDAIADLAIMINLHHELADPLAGYREASRLLHGGAQLLVVDWAPSDTNGGPPQEIRASAEDIRRDLSMAGFERVVSHTGLPRHTLVTGSKGA
jgi:ubiquinone/menaquinone biosynthesis C-methylase UbiE